METLLYLQSWTYLGIFILALLGNLGLPVPEEAIFVTAGYLASKGIANLWIVILVSLLSIIITNNMSFWAGRWFGRLLFKFFKKFKGISKIIKKTETLFNKYGKQSVFCSRFIWNVRNFSPLIAGASKMKWKNFQLYDFLAALIYTPLIVLLGFFFSEFLDLVLGKVESIKIIIFILFVIFVVIWASRKVYCSWHNHKSK